jgi:hypothetical protein
MLISRQGNSYACPRSQHWDKAGTPFKLPSGRRIFGRTTATGMSFKCRQFDAGRREPVSISPESFREMGLPRDDA